LGQLRLELFPSGHILGSASLLVTHKDKRIVYAGHINPRTSPLAERLELRNCDILVLACPFGQRRFAFPPHEQVSQSLVRFVAQTIEQECTPVILCSPIGEAQEVIALLLEGGIRCRVHRRIYAACQVYHQAGYLPEGVRSFMGQPGAKEALIWPVALRNSPSLARLPDIRRALVSGLALDEEAAKHLACDATFPLSAHSDYAGLLEYVQACKPGQVVLTHGASGELTEDLEALGIEVTRIAPPKQMDLF
jgi:Cft2 family RNA processing exonuclease